MKKSSKSSKTTTKKLTVSVKASVSKSTGKTTYVRGLLNGLEFKKHTDSVDATIAKDATKEDFRTRFKRVGSPKSLIVPKSISASTYETIRFKKVDFTLGNRLPQVMKQVYNNDLIFHKGVIFGFEKKKSAVDSSEYVDFRKADITIKRKDNVITLTNFINNSSGKSYKMKFSSKKDAKTWFSETLNVGTYKPVLSYKKS